MSVHSSPTPIVLSEANSRLPPSASLRDITTSVEAARLVGLRVYGIPSDFRECEHADNAIYHIPQQYQLTTAFWIGYIPELERHEAIYRAALGKNIRLVNTPHQHRIAQEFDHACPLLQGLTPASAVITEISQTREAAQSLGFPLFIKGCVQSRKARGWNACVAENSEDLEKIVAPLFELSARTRGRVILRKLARLRYERSSAEGFPLGREYRVFLLHNQILALSYYWGKAAMDCLR